MSGATTELTLRAAAGKIIRTARPTRAMLSGWGRWPRAECELSRPEKLSELRAALLEGKAAVIARGSGRSYGDAAINAGNRVIGLERLDRMMAFDAQSGVLRCEAGVTIGDIIETFLPRGFFPPVTPGTRFVTLGGAIAADIHGKNHHRDSSIAKHVLSFELMIASGEIRHCSREHNRDLFIATVGGMGLTGLILEAELVLHPVESAWIDAETVRAENLDAAIAEFERADREYGYSMAWIDCASRGGALGRSVITRGNFARLEQLDATRRRRPLRLGPRFSPAVPFDFPSFALNSGVVRAFNHFYYAIHRGGRGLVDYRPFFYPLDAIRNWNRIYGARGFVQYQCVWPEGESRAGLIEVLEAASRSHRGSFLAVLKKFGAQEGLMSFPMQGYTLALDFPLDRGLLPFLKRLDEMVLKRGGRVYLAKDARLEPEIFAAMYPGLKRWRELKTLADPNRRFSSSLSRRIGMEPA